MGRNCLLERLDGALVTFALGVDVSEEVKSKSFINRIINDAQDLGYEARAVLKDTKDKIYHLHFIRRLD